jgi:NAD(P)-dependent dehydrogenase (short-subunit alcohol dehydrogenase family)
MQDTRSVAELFSLSGKTALITGGTGHLGRAMSRALAEAGASVIISSRDRTRAAQAAAFLPVVGDATHHGVQLDYTDDASIGAGFTEAVEAGSKVDVLVNNGYALSQGDLTNITGENFDRQLANATGCFLLARCVHDHAVERTAPASIIMLGSMYGIVGSYPEAYAGVCSASSVAYHALKGGILQVTRHLAVYWAVDGIRVNALSPGPFPSPKAPGEMVERLCTKSPMRRMGRPDELKGAVVFLASDASSYVTGHNLVVDGGWTAW